MTLRQTPLYGAHLKLSAKMVPFAGWEMPVSYSSIIKEHQAVRNSVGIFDIGHMGVIKISGSKALDLIQHLTSNDASYLAVNQAQYSLVLNPQGGVKDDVLVYHLSSYFLVVVNAVNADKILAWFKENNSGGCDIDLLYDKLTLLALQGPLAELTLSKVYAISLPAYHRAAEIPQGLISRSGYTGEDGFEFFVRPKEALLLWEKLLSLGAVPCGLGARDTLRLEAGLPLYGHELSEDLNPLEAGLAWAVKFDKGPFVGKEALEKIPLARKRIGFKVPGGAIPRENYPILDAAEKVVGRVTSGTFSPTLGVPIAMGMVEKNVQEGLFVEIRGQKHPAEVVPLPFYKRRKT